MIRSAILLAAVAALAGPAFAETPSRDDLRSGRCTVQQVHTPAGKTVHAAPIVRCGADKSEIAAREKATPRPDTTPTGRD